MSNWKRDPSGLINGNLRAWRENMYAMCPNPNSGDIVITTDKDDKQVGYECVTPDGFDTVWARVSRDKMAGLSEGVHRRPMEAQSYDYNGGAEVCAEGIYLGDGVYIDPDDCWF